MEPDRDSGDRQTAELAEQVYETLRQVAAGYLRRQPSDHTLQPTALVHEAFLKLAGRQQTESWEGKTHFQAVASIAMRQILVDYARKRGTKKRGGNCLRVTLTADVAPDDDSALEVLALDEALQTLEELDERKCRVVELRFFGGLTCAEAASQLGVSPKTAEGDWYFARAWLRERLEESGP